MVGWGSQFAVQHIWGFLNVLEIARTAEQSRWFQEGEGGGVVGGEEGMWGGEGYLAELSLNDFPHWDAGSLSLCPTDNEEERRTGTESGVVDED